MCSSDLGCTNTFPYVCEAGCLWTSWYDDADGDGYGDPNVVTRTCTAPTGTVADANDCDDTDPAISPSATEVCGGVDEDCDGLVDDDDDPVSGTSTWFVDADADGYGDAASPTAAGGADDDDADGDGDAAVAYGGADCDDSDATASSTGIEACDAADDDCDGSVDEDACSVPTATYGDHTYLFLTTRADRATAQAACAALGYHLADISDATEDAWLWAEAEAADDGTGWWHGYADLDVEGTFAWDGGASFTYTNWRAGEPNDYGGNEDCGAWSDDSGGVWNDKDCAQTLAYICEAGCAQIEAWTDADGDGYGVDALIACEGADSAPAGGDCDDTDATVSPAGIEQCDAADVDEDCDGLADDADDADGLTTWYTDADGDGFGDPDAPVLACDLADGRVADDTDCDDGDATIFPGAEEREDGEDDDCDGVAELDDADGDGIDRHIEEALGTDPDAADSDGDGLTDGEEIGDPDAPEDHDSDGLIDALDADDDDDRLTTLGELADHVAGGDLDDSDGDGTPDHLDLDSDDDGVPDGLDDGLEDLDLDGLQDEDDPDDDGDGVPTIEEGDGDTDGDGLPDYRDADDDRDPEAGDDTAGEGAGGGTKPEPDCGCGGGSASGAWVLVLAGLVRRGRR